MKKINPILEGLKDNRQLISVDEWVLSNLGPNISVEVDLGKEQVSPVLVSGGKQTTLVYSYFKRALESEFKKKLIEVISDYYSKAGKKDISVEKAGEIVKALGNDPKSKGKGFQEVVRDLLVTSVNMSSAAAGYQAVELEKVFLQAVNFKI